jgi:hypothetical protein
MPAGVYFAGFDVFPVLNDAGAVAFKAQLGGDGITSVNDDSIWCGNSKWLDMEAREGAPAPLLSDGAAFQSFGFPSLNSANQVAFPAQLTGQGVSQANNDSVWRSVTGALQLASREGTPAPGTPAGVRFGELSMPDFNDSGEVAISAGLIGIGVGGSNDTGIWGGADSVALLLREGSAAPGTPAGVNFQGSIATRLNNAGQVAVLSFLGGLGVTTANNEGIWIGTPGNLNLVARRGNAAAGAAPGVVFSDVYGFTLNDVGQVAFGGTLAGTGVTNANDEGVWRGNQNSLQLVARKGSQAPGASAATLFNGFATPALNAAGQVAFRALVTGANVTPANDQGIWRGTPTAMRLVAREGAAAVAAGPGLVYLSFTEEPGLNDGGQVVFQSTLAGPGVNYLNDVGVYLSDGEETVQIAREGQPLAGSTIQSVSAPTGQGNQGRPIINQHGQVVYTANLANGRQGVFLYTPEVQWRRSFGGQWDSSGNWTLSLSPGAPHDVRINPASSVTVFGPTSTAQVNSLLIGGGSGAVTLDLQQGGTIAATSGVAVQQNAVISGDGTIGGSVVNFGTIVADNLTITDGLNNRGIVTGRGRINAALNNAATVGKVQVAGGEQLRFSGAHEHTNSHRIDVTSGGLTFDGKLTNAATGSITASDALLRFGGGLVNAGAVGFSLGANNIFGDIQNEATAKITLTGNSHATFHDDVVNNGELFADAGSTAVYLGNVSGAGMLTGAGTHQFEGTFSPGNSPGFVAIDGDLNLGRSAKLELEIGGTAAGLSYDQLHLDGALVAEGKLEVSLLDGFTPAYGQSFNLISFDDRNGWFNSVQLPALANGLRWQESLTADSYTIGVVPEPAMLTWTAIVAGILLYWRRRRTT